MSAAEDDTELRDLLIQNLENSGVLNKLKVPQKQTLEYILPRRTTCSDDRLKLALLLADT